MAGSTESTICVPLPQFCGAPTIRRAILEAQVVNCVLERTASPASSLEFAQQDVNVFRSRGSAGNGGRGLLRMSRTQLRRSPMCSARPWTALSRKGVADDADRQGRAVLAREEARSREA